MYPMPIMTHASVAAIAHHHQLHGPCLALTTACSAGADAIGEAFETIAGGYANRMLAGGSDSAITYVGISVFANIGALSTRNEEPERASRPYDKARDGFVMGEGSAMLILEDLEFAQARGAHILAEMVGYGSTGDAHHVTEPAPGGAGLVRAIRRALQKAGLQPNQVDYYNAHATSTPYNDRSETQALKTVFGEHAWKLPISGTKSMIGHTLGAAGAVGAVVAIQSILTGIVPPTINLHHPDPDCDLNYVPNEALRVTVNVAMSNSMGFGGHNTCLIFKRYEE